MPIRRTRDYKIRYTTDLFFQRLAVQRTFVEVNNGQILTPITPSFLTRVVPDENVLEPITNLEPRNIETCFANPNNQSGESKFNVIIPFNPDEIGHREQIKEIENYPNILSCIYFGEKYTGNILDRL